MKAPADFLFPLWWKCGNLIKTLLPYLSPPTAVYRRPCMRKLLLSFSLCLLLLTAQLGALVHELSHVTAVAHQDVHFDAAKATQTACALCLAYSQLANPASHATHTTRVEPTACAAESTLAPTNLPLAVPTARSRGPPVQLNS
jgi:hypothetical protein